MTEWQWLACANPVYLISAVHGQTSERKRRLFVAACCRQLWGELPSDSVLLALDCIEHFCEPSPARKSMEVSIVSAGQRGICSGASDPVDAFEVRSEHDLTSLIIPARGNPPPEDAIPLGLTSILEHLSCQRDVQTAAEWAGIPYLLARDGLPEARQAEVFREVVRGPYRPLDFRRAEWCRWEGGVIPVMAQEAYEERVGPSGELDGWRLAVLADALEDAGCREDELLDHLRSPEPHVRGCWAVDLVLGRA